MPLSFSEELLREMVEDSERRYPEEACGLVLGPRGHATSVAALPNVYGRYHKLDPGRFPRDARTAYKMDELKVMNLVDEASRRGEELVCIYHSHTDVGAYFSAEDRAVALAEGVTPLWPGAEYLVLAIDDGMATAAKCFRWDGADFVARDVALPAARGR